MVLHIYNPEHDIALAKNNNHFTPPKAARMTKEHYWYIPALWADDGDWVLREPTQESNREFHNGEMFNSLANVKFVTYEDLAKLKAEEMPEKVDPWGWDRLVVSQLVKCNHLFKYLVPSDEELDTIREMSSRAFVAENILHEIVSTHENFIGEMTICRNEEDIEQQIKKNSGSIVLKSPWSCSGRGVKFIDGGLTESEKGWIRNVLCEQHVIMAEPKYNKVLDFAMEFMAHKNEGTRYMGLNIFSTKNGAYLQNAQGKEEDKLAELCKFVDINLIYTIKNKIIEITSREFKGQYSGPFGIDMMIIRDADNKTKIHPCVEMNLRHTMGQTAYPSPPKGRDV